MRQAPDQPAVGVLLTSYNRAEFLAEAIESVLAQTYRDLHLVIVDDGSTDGCVDLIRRISSAEPRRVTPIYKAERAGATDSFNRGLALLRRFPYIAFLDDDDLWYADKLAKQVPLIDRDTELGLVFTEAEIIDGHGVASGQRFSDIFGAPDLREPATYLFSKGNFVCYSSALVRQEALALIGFQYELLHGMMKDSYMWQVISAHYRVDYIPEVLTSYRRSESSVSIADPSLLLRESYENRLLALRRFPAVEAAAGGQPAGLRILDDYALYWGIHGLRARQYADYAWYSRRLLERRSALLAAKLMYRTARTFVGRGVRAIAHHFRTRTG